MCDSKPGDSRQDLGIEISTHNIDLEMCAFVLSQGENVSISGGSSSSF